MLKYGRRVKTSQLPAEQPMGDRKKRMWNFRETNESIGNDKSHLDYADQFEILFKNGPDAFFTYDLKGTFLSGNKAAELLTGYNKEELIGKNFLKLKLMSIPDAVKAAKILSDIRCGKIPGTEEFVLYKKDGTPVPVEIHSYPVIKNGDSLVFGIARDISRKKEREKNLIENEKKLRNITESVNDAIVMADENGDISFWNSPAEKLFGYKRNDVLGANLANLIFPEEFARNYWNRYKRFDGTGKDPLIGELTNIIARKSNGEEFRIGLSISVVEINGERHALGVIRDITEQVIADNELKKKTRELENRLGELNCLYDISMLMAKENSSVDDVLRKTASIIPLSFQDPENTVVKILLNNGLNFSSEKWNDSAHKLSSDIVSGKDIIGSLLIGNMVNKQNHDEGPFRTEEKNLLKAIGVMIGDFIQKKNTESALIESEKKFRAMSEAAKDAIVMMDENGKVTFWNKAAEGMFGYKPGEIIGMNLHKTIVPGKYYSGFEKGFEEFKKTGKGNAIGTQKELMALNKSGNEFPVELSLSGVRINGNWNSIGIVRDISNRTKEHKKLINSEKDFRSLFENSTLGIYRSTPNGRLLMANSTAVSLLGFESVDELKAINLDELYSEGFAAREDFKRILKNEGTVYGFENRINRPDGKTIYIRESARAIFNEDGKPEYYEGTFEDITEKKIIEAELINAKEQAEEMNRLKTNFLANMSHELRTPITGISGFADILLNELQNDDHKQMAVNILQSSERLSNTLEQILDISQIETNKLGIEQSKINIVEVIEECLYSYEQEANNKGLKFVYEKKQKQIYCNIDSRLMIKLVSKILDNAIKFTDNGIISVKVFSNEQAVIQIKDTGIGIPEDMADIVFEPFRQGSEGYARNYEGSGLGLTIAKKYVEVSGGTISVESKKKSGTTFTICFPLIN